MSNEVRPVRRGREDFVFYKSDEIIDEVKYLVTRDQVPPRPPK